MTLERCETCGEYKFTGHRCDPVYDVWSEDEDECDALQLRGQSHENAVENWAQRVDCESADYDIVAQRSEPTVFVRDQETGEIRKFRVTGESVPCYHATEITSD